MFPLLLVELCRLPEPNSYQFETHFPKDLSSSLFTSLYSSVPTSELEILPLSPILNLSSYAGSSVLYFKCQKKVSQTLYGHILNSYFLINLLLFYVFNGFWHFHRVRLQTVATSWNALSCFLAHHHERPKSADLPPSDNFSNLSLNFHFYYPNVGTHELSLRLGFPNL